MKKIGMIVTQDESNTSQPALGDVQWSAMQYVLGELSDEQTELFESAMTDDVAVCDAVLAATRLTYGIALACESQPSTQPLAASLTLIAAPIAHRRPAFARFGVFSAATALLLVVLAVTTLKTPRMGDDVVAFDDAAADALALLLDDAEASDMNTDLDELTGSDDSVTSLVAPEWLLTAVDLDAAETSSKDHPAVRPDDATGVN